MTLIGEIGFSLTTQKVRDLGNASILLSVSDLITLIS